LSSSQAPAPSATPEVQKLILDRYDQRIGYYWKASQINKHSYKMTRYLTVVLAAVTTLVASISSASFIKSSDALALIFAVATPMLAAMMAIVAGISQAFQWGAAWSDMVITATRLEKERDRIAVTPPQQIDPAKEMGVLDDLVLDETQGFFQRLLGSGGPGKTSSTAP